MFSTAIYRYFTFSSRSQLTKCDKCDYVGASTGALTYHVQIKHLKMFRYECPKCDKFKTQTKPQIVKHLMEEHDVLEEDINDLVKSKLRLQNISYFETLSSFFIHVLLSTLEDKPLNLSKIVIKPLMIILLTNVREHSHMTSDVFLT